MQYIDRIQKSLEKNDVLGSVLDVYRSLFAKQDDLVVPEDPKEARLLVQARFGHNLKAIESLGYEFTVYERTQKVRESAMSRRKVDGKFYDLVAVHPRDPLNVLLIGKGLQPVHLEYLQDKHYPMRSVIVEDKEEDEPV